MHPRIYCRLGRALQEIGERDEAAAAFEVHLRNARTVAVRRPGLTERHLRIALAEHLLAALRGESPPVAPAAYVSSLFDKYATSYDEHMLTHLRYQVPDILYEELRSEVETLGMTQIRRVADLGAGTGLMGERLRLLAPEARLEAVDLSRSMLRQALSKGCYDRLLLADACAVFTPRRKLQPTVLATPGEEQLEVEEPEAAGTTQDRDAYDIVVAADAFTYIGELDGVFALVRQWLRPAVGLFCFSMERGHGDGFTLAGTGRYTHGYGYVHILAARHGFEVARQREMALRYDRSSPVEGCIFVLRARG